MQAFSLAGWLLSTMLRLKQNLERFGQLSGRMVPAKRLFLRQLRAKKS